MRTSQFDRTLYHLYIYMLRRCYNSSAPGYYRYGGRGITVCDRWRIGYPRGQGFRNFKADMCPRPKGYSLDRINNDGPYSPENCRWVPWKEQHRNRSDNVWIEFQGVRMIAKDWSLQTGVRDDVIVKRLRRGIPPEIALFERASLHPRDTSSMIKAAAKKKREQTHCKRGHPLSGDNLHVYKNPNGWIARVCRACKREALSRRRKAKLAGV